MTQGRPSIPRALERKVKEEAGHRCAIPTCKATSALEMAHIVPWSQVREHKFDNLILLCAICHTRYDKGDIDRKSIYAYKDNLGVVNSRYGDFEKRILEFFAEHPGANTIKLHGVEVLFLKHLIDDQMIREVMAPGGQVLLNGVSVDRHWQITSIGKDFVTKWFAGQDL